jgi:signal peptidase I
MMGDNRHNSEDSRYWGYVPEDHIVGKPVFIWMSWDTNGKGFGKIRWERLFTTVGGDGQPQSYFKLFLIALAAFFAGEYFWKKRKEKNIKV